MGTGFETRAASHIAEGNNKTLITPEFVHRRAVSKDPFLKFSWVFQGQFYYKLSPRKWERTFKKLWWKTLLITLESENKNI